MRTERLIIFLLSGIVVVLASSLLVINQELGIYKSEIKQFHEKVKDLNRVAIVNIPNKPSDPMVTNFEPAVVRVVLGFNNTVLWVNSSDVSTTVTSDEDLFDSGLIYPGNVWSFRFEKNGEYSYHSKPHPWLRGKIIVTEKESVWKITTDKISVRLGETLTVTIKDKNGVSYPHDIIVRPFDATGEKGVAEIVIPSTISVGNITLSVDDRMSLERLGTITITIVS